MPRIVFAFLLLTCEMVLNVRSVNKSVGQPFIEEVHSLRGKHKRSVRIRVYHYIVPHWGISRSGDYSCEKHVKCEWIVGEQLTYLGNHVLEALHSHHNLPVVTLALYNIHTLWEKYRDLKPQLCQLATNITMYETEESVVRFSWYFNNANQHFDSYSSTHPNSDVQRVYSEAFLNRSDFLSLKNFSSLIKAGSYIASDCHRHDGANSNRDGIVRAIRDLGFRVDGLGRCLHTSVIPEGIGLQKFRNTQYNLFLKREVINNYAFNMAFENSLEDGYVTEKPFDALIAGTVPVYLGDAKHLKRLLPHPNAAIFIEDFDNLTMLVNYLKYLIVNETAYEQHRAWRSIFTEEGSRKRSPFLQRSWQCNVCEWVAKQYFISQQHSRNMNETVANQERSSANQSHKITNRLCEKKEDPVVVKEKLSKDQEGRLIRHRNQKSVYVVKQGILHLIPDFNTFLTLGYDVSNINVVDSHEFDRMIIGEDLPRSSP